MPYLTGVLTGILLTILVLVLSEKLGAANEEVRKEVHHATAPDGQPSAPAPAETH